MRHSPKKLAFEAFENRLVLNASPFFNEALPADVNGSGNVTLRDALEIVSLLRANDSQPIESLTDEAGQDVQAAVDDLGQVDVNNDDSLTLTDALQVVHHLRDILPATAGQGALLNLDELLTEAHGRLLQQYESDSALTQNDVALAEGNIQVPGLRAPEPIPEISSEVFNYQLGLMDTIIAEMGKSPDNQDTDLIDATMAELAESLEETG